LSHGSQKRCNINALTYKKIKSICPEEWDKANNIVCFVVAVVGGKKEVGLRKY
jgi:hypothetical protein